MLSLLFSVGLLFEQTIELVRDIFTELIELNLFEGSFL